MKKVLRGNRNFHSHVLLRLGTKVPYMELSLSGTFVPWNSRSLELSFPGTLVPRNSRSQELLFPGTFAPLSENEVELSLLTQS